MWNSNSVISWLIAGSGLSPESIHPPAGGRAPGWQAGIVIARRQEAWALEQPCQATSAARFASMPSSSCLNNSENFSTPSRSRVATTSP